ncbi:MAG: HEAT repeat domain-containing protein [Planctomyces sp.]|nr:HEAT repeat domain-containing protein [Planctomyces sp.]
MKKSDFKHRLFCVLAGIIFAVVISPDVLAQRELKDIPVPDPELERQTFRVPEGFEVTLFAADPRIAKPIQMNFDEDGRLWIVSSEVYPQIKPGEQSTDRVVVLEDKDQDGKADETHIFASGLLIPTGIAPGDGGAWVANSTELLHYKDTDGDLIADSKNVVLSGFGTEDTHHILHTLRWGPDGFLYFNQSIYIHSHIETPWGVRRLNAGGIWQFRPETLELGVFLRGLVNSWGHHFDRFGQSFATDGAGGEGINYVIPGAYYFTAADASRILSGLNPGSPKHCGLELVETHNLPADWQGSAITNDFRGHRVCRFTLTEEGSGFVSREQQEVIASDHVAFRPVDVKLGPDGAIYIADWYNPIIQHGEVDFRDERRDHTHGRIWRVRWTGAKTSGWPMLSKASNVELFESLRSDDGFRRQAAKQLLRQRGTGIISELRTWLDMVQLTQEERDHVHLEAAWCFQAARVVDEELLNELLASEDAKIRAAGVRLLSHWKYQIPSSFEKLRKLVTDAHPRVRLEAVRAISYSPLEDSQRQMALDPEFTGVETSHPAASEIVNQFDLPVNIETALLPLRQPMDRFLDYGLWLTTRELSDRWLTAFHEGKVTFANDPQMILFAFSALGTEAPFERLIGNLYAADTTSDQRGQLLRLMARSASEAQLSQMVRMAAEQKDSASLKTLLTSTAGRTISVSGDVSLLESLWDSEDELLRRAVLEAAGTWKIAALEDRLRQVAGSSSADAGDRLAAFRGIAAGKDTELLQVLADVASESGTAMNLRAAALAELASGQPEQAASLAGSVLSVMKPGDPAGLVAHAFLTMKNGSSLLSSAIQDQTLDTEIARELLRTLRESGRADANLETILKRAGKIAGRKALSAEDRIRLLELARTTASAAQGEQVFRNEQLGCLKCHGIAGAGGLVGPDMVSLGASAQPDYLLESLLDPNAKVKENYHTIVVATIEGKVISGIQIQQSDTTLTLRLADNTVVNVARSDVEESSQGVSLMPEGLVDTLTDAELAGLVRFLSELGRTPEFTVSRRRLARGWHVMQPTDEAIRRIQRTSYGQSATDDPAFNWKSQYSSVSGTLPLRSIPGVAGRSRGGVDNPGVGFVRARLNVTTPGLLRIRLNSAEGLELRIDDQPVDVASEMDVELSAGQHRLTFAVDLALRTQPLEAELIDGGSGNAEWIQQ